MPVAPDRGPVEETQRERSVLRTRAAFRTQKRAATAARRVASVRWSLSTRLACAAVFPSALLAAACPPCCQALLFRIFHACLRVGRQCVFSGVLVDGDAQGLVSSPSACRRSSCSLSVSGLMLRSRLRLSFICRGRPGRPGSKHLLAELLLCPRYYLSVYRRALAFFGVPNF